MALGDLTQALALATIAQDGGIVQRERSAADGPAFETGATHAGTHALDDQVALKFGDGADDHHDGPAQRAAGVDLLSERDELEVEPNELIEHFEQVPG